MYLGQYAEQYNPHYLGRGQLYAGPPMRTMAAGMLPGRSLGNASALAVQPSVRRLNTSAWDARSNLLIEGITVTATLYGHGAANLAMALDAQRVQTASAQISTDIDVGNLQMPAGSMLWVPHQVDRQRPVLVAPSWATWTEGVEWRRADWGIELLQGIDGPPGGVVRIVSTSEGSAEVLHGGAGGDAEIGLAYAGVNAVDSKPVRLLCYRARPVLEQGLSVLAQSVGSVQLTLQLRPVARPDNRPAWYDLARALYPTI